MSRLRLTALWRRQWGHTEATQHEQGEGGRRQKGKASIDSIRVHCVAIIDLGVMKGWLPVWIHQQQHTEGIVINLTGDKERAGMGMSIPVFVPSFRDLFFFCFWIFSYHFP